MEGEEEPKIVELKFIDKEHETMQICIPPGTVHSEKSLMYLIYNTFGGFAEYTVSTLKERNNGKLGDEIRPPDISP